MSTDQHPSLSTENADVPSLALVLPGHLGADETLASLTRAISQARAELARWARQCQDRVLACQASGDQLRQARCHGQVLAAEHAIAHLDESIIEKFGLWDQYERQVPGPAGAEPVVLRLPGTGRLPRRPRAYPVPRRTFTPAGIDPGTRVTSQRSRRDGLTAEQNSPLDQTGFSRNSREDAWHARYREAAAFQDQHGHLSATYHTPLGAWLDQQRKEHAAGRLTSDQEQLLRDLGALSSPADRTRP
jgi:hypothetical protein